MIKMSVLSAWADLQVASLEQEYLVEVVKPYVTQLTPLWLSSLQDFARLRFEPDSSSSMVVTPDDDLDMVYAAFNRQTLLKVPHPFLTMKYMLADVCSFTKTLGLRSLTPSPA